MEENTPKRHDKFFKRTFSHLPTARSLFERYLPEDILNLLDLSTLKIETSSFVTPELSEHFSDLVFSCSFTKEVEEKMWEMVKPFYKEKDIKEGKIGPSKILIHLLFEHKSFRPKNPRKQLGKYIFEIYDTQEDPEERLSPVVPILFFHGKGEWEEYSFYHYFNGLTDPLKRFIPHFDYLLINTKNIDDETIFLIQYALLRNALLAFKHSWDNEYIKENFALFFRFESSISISEEEKINFSLSLFVYLVKNSLFSNEEASELMRKVPNPIKNYVMSTYENILEKGREEGREEGRELGREEGREIGREEEKLNQQTKTILNGYAEGLSIPFLAKILSVSENYVIEILKKHGEL